MLSLLLIASLVSLCLSQILSLRPQDDPFASNALVEHTHPQHRQRRFASPPQPDSDPLDNIDLLDIILLASVDGKFHALNRTSGHVLWSMSPYASASSSTSSAPGSGTPVTETTTKTHSGPTALSPLVRTDHIDYDPETTDDSTPQEMYIIEPQSGDIYVMPNPSSPLQRFPFSMQELVDMSPFSFDGEEDGRVFVGKKETSLLVVELETGKIKATLNSECPWDQFEEFRKGSGGVDTEDDLDLDELDGSKPQKPPMTDVYIGRTDYHVSIITRPNPTSSSSRSSANNLIQNLSFSTYGPNRQDAPMQALYRRTKDGAYIQPLPSGEIMSFKAKNPVEPVVQPAPLWALNFSQPIVAIFDVLRKKPSTESTLLGGFTNKPSQPFVLLQPRPKLQDLFPNLPSSMKENLRTAYVGLVEETGSLFAMSPQNFPLVVFGRNDKRVKMIGSSQGESGQGGSGGGGKGGEGEKGWSGSTRVVFGKGSPFAQDEDEDDGMISVDELTKRRKLREAGQLNPHSAHTDNNNDSEEEEEEEEELIECHEKVMNDRRCLIGVRRLELHSSNGAETRMKRLLDASPSAMQYGEYQEYYPPSSSSSSSSGDHSHSHGGEVANESRNLPQSGQGQGQGQGPLTIDPAPLLPPSLADVHSGIVSGLRIWEAVGATVVLGFITFWVLTRGETWRKALGLGSIPAPGSDSISGLSTSSSSATTSASASGGYQNHGLEGKDGLEQDIPSSQEIPTPASSSQVVVGDATVIPIPPPRTPATPIPAEVNQPIPLSESRTLTPTPATPATPVPVLVPGMTTGGDETDKDEGDGTNTDVGEDDFIVVSGDSGSGSNNSGNANGSAGPATPANVPTTPNKKKVRRGKRGAKKPKNATGANGDATPQVNGKGKEKEKEKEKEEVVTQVQTPPSSLVVTNTLAQVVTPGPSLVVSDNVLGYGSHGTVVYKGSLQGRAVAVKRLLADFVTLASREVSILQESDDHPNVIRYYYQEAHAGFLYIALELCPASLADLIETPDRDAWREIAVNFDPKRALRQVTNGLRHLHGLKLVHRDIKPQNILVSVKTLPSGKIDTSGRGGGNYRMLISDFGLCKKLDVDQTSFLPTAHGAMAAGTVGWRAPEILSGEVKLNEFAEDGQSQSSRGSTATVQGASISSSTSTSSNSSTGAGGKGRTRLTKSVDIFALGCLYYYTLTGGGHPFGDRYEREVNIMKNAKNLELLERFGEEGTEAVDLIERMLDPLPSERPDTTSCLLHPFFWDSSRRLNFLQDASDRFEIMCRDPKDPNLLTLEDGAVKIVGNDWHSRLDRIFIENLGKFRKYDGRSVQDLLRALRNKKHHYQDLPDNVKRHLGPMPEGFLAYFTRRFPNLFLHVHGVVKETGLADESMFRSYFELPES